MPTPDKHVETSRADTAPSELSTDVLAGSRSVQRALRAHLFLDEVAEHFEIAFRV